VVVPGLLLVTATVTGILAAFVWRHHDEAGTDWFVALMGATTLWVGTDLVGEFVASRFPLLVVDRASTVMATVVPSLWFCFVLAYTGREHLLDRRGLAAVWTVPGLVVAAILTSPAHRLYYRTVEFSVRSGDLAFVSRPGPLAWLNLAYFAVLTVVGLSLLARLLSGTDRLYTRQAGWLLVGTLAPVALLVALLGLGASERFPALSLGFSVLGLAYARGLFTHRLFDLSPASRRIGIAEAFDDLGEGVVVATGNGDVVAINDRACRLFACEREGVLGRPLATVADPLDAVGLEPGRTDVRVHGRVLAASVSSVYDARDRLTGYALVARDVTEERRREQRLAVLDRVFRHNIRNTMNAVVGPTAILANELDGDERDMAATARDASERVLSLSESVHEVERMMTRAVAPAPVPVAELVDNVVVSVRNGTEFEAEVSVPADLTLVTDASILGTVLENVVSNAADHAGSTRPTVEIGVEPREGGCLVHVTDDGPGIPDGELAALQSGTETDLAHGSGIGLWAIHWGVTRLDGAVRFRDTGTGTRVSLWLPSLEEVDSDADDTGATTDPATAPATDPRSGRPANGQPERGDWFGPAAPPQSDGDGS
jgi:signal transduction histidine kinase